LGKTGFPEKRWGAQSLFPAKPREGTKTTKKKKKSTLMGGKMGQKTVVETTLGDKGTPWVGGGKGGVESNPPQEAPFLRTRTPQKKKTHKRQ